MRLLSQTTQFARDVKLMRKRGKDRGKLQEVVRMLAAGMPIPAQHRDHPLLGPWRPARDSHIEPDWILIHTADDQTLRLERTGSHSDLLRK